MGLGMASFARLRKDVASAWWVWVIGGRIAKH